MCFLGEKWIYLATRTIELEHTHASLAHARVKASLQEHVHEHFCRCSARSGGLCPGGSAEVRHECVHCTPRLLIE